MIGLRNVALLLAVTLGSFALAPVHADPVTYSETNESSLGAFDSRSPRFLTPFAASHVGGSDWRNRFYAHRTMVFNPRMLYRIEVSSNDFQPVLLLVGPGNTILQREVGVRGGTARLRIPPGTNGLYSVYVTTWDEGQTGSYFLNVVSGSEGSR